MPSLMRYINIIARCNMLWRADRLRDTGIKPGQAPYIVSLCRNPGLSQEQLARRIYIDKSNVTRQLGALEREGFIERRQSETDRRVTLVYPTDRAMEIYPYVRQIHREWNEYLTEGWTEEDIEALKVILARVSDRAAVYAQRKLDNDPDEEKGDDTACK